MIDNRYENMSKEEIKNALQDGLTVNNDAERKTVLHSMGIKTDEEYSNHQRTIVLGMLLVLILLLLQL